MCVGADGPDLTLVLDLSMDIARTRMKARSAAQDAIESRDLAYHAAVHQAFLDIARANPQRCLVLDASASPESLAQDALAEITRRFPEVR
jgi:dTMP kinase